MNIRAEAKTLTEIHRTSKLVQCKYCTSEIVEDRIMFRPCQAHERTAKKLFVHRPGFISTKPANKAPLMGRISWWFQIQRARIQLWRSFK